MARCPIHQELLQTYSTTLTKMEKSFECVAGKCPWCTRIYLNIPFFHHYDEVEIQGNTYLYHKQLAHEYPENNYIEIINKNCKHIIPNYKPGDIVNFISDIPPSSESQKKKRHAISERNPYKLIILKQIDEELYLVAIGKRKEKRTQLKISTNHGPIHIITSSFFPIDIHAITFCDDFHFIDNRKEIIKQIQNCHATHLLDEKRKKLIKQKKKGTKHNKSQAKKTSKRKLDKATKNRLANEYGLKYEIAVMNNDKKKMKEIENVAGTALFATRYKTRNGKVLYSSFNPRPSSGGMFTPK